MGDYVVDEVLDDGRLVIRRNTSADVIRRNTSADAIRRRQGLAPISPTAFEQQFGHLPTDDEG